MSLLSVAIIFDNQVRPDTTGGYCLRALQKLVTVKHFLPSELNQVPRQGFDLYLNIDDGLEYRLPTDLRPCAWWAIDTHLNPDWCLGRARDFDFIFTAQRDGADQMQDAGIETACWLPLACDPEIHRKHDVPKTLDFCFVGHVFPGPRRAVGSAPATLSQPLCGPAVLRGDGKNLFGLADRLQPQHSQRHQYASV